jgi:hypothetical protein
MKRSEFEFAQTFDIGELAPAFSNYDEIIAVERVVPHSVIGVHFESGKIYFSNKKRISTFEKFPSYFDHIKYQIGARVAAAGENSTILPMDKWSVYGGNVQGKLHIFAVKNQYGDYMSWKHVQEFAITLGVGTMPVIYKGRFDFSTLHNMLFRPSDLTGEDHTTLLIFTDPPKKDVVHSNLNWLYGRFVYTPGKSPTKKNSVQIANEFAKINTTGDLFDSAYKFVLKYRDAKDTEFSIKKKMHALIFWRLMQEKNAEVSHYTDLISAGEKDGKQEAMEMLYAATSKQIDNLYDYRA